MLSQKNQEPDSVTSSQVFGLDVICLIIYILKIIISN